MHRLPAICLLCNQYHRNSHAICKECHQLLIRLGPACQHCAIPLPDQSSRRCGICIQQQPWLDNVYTTYRFEEPLRTLVHEFKYRKGLYLSSYLCELILDAHPDHHVQCIIPIPMHPKRLHQRGYNQAAILAKQLANILKRPCELTQCKKIINTPPQASLNAKQRKKNSRNTFQARALPFTHIALVDDLLTTGSTANELARMFKQQGVVQVDLWCCARVIG